MKIRFPHYNTNKMWNDRTMPNNKPDIIIRDNKKGTCVLIDVAITGDRYVIKKAAEKILNYNELTTEIQHTWNLQANVITVISGANGTISKSLRKYLSTVPGKNEFKEMQNSSILVTAHILRKVLI
jgi:hypothetical protein